MPLSPKEVSEQLSVRRYLSLCSTVDMKLGVGAKFDVVKIEPDDKTFKIVVIYPGGILDELRIAA